MDTLANVSVLGGMYNTGSSCLHLSAQHWHLPMVERLLAAGANAKAADYRSEIASTRIVRSICHGIPTSSQVLDDFAVLATLLLSLLQNDLLSPCRPKLFRHGGRV